ncbi:unnamed protein product [Nezara viridula]|uniref:Uncharacterized protein n=1 Tax=Nezara viridula TaxID=85310 RepID=A0A9P0MRR3_NEZVI|nr:unnamed protein product [Nezara viridula]
MTGQRKLSRSRIATWYLLRQ